MSFKRIVLFLVFFISTAFAKDMNIVIFLTDENKFDEAFVITNGLQKGLEKGVKADIELVMGGSSVEIFASQSKKNLQKQAQIQSLTALPNVRVVACSGAMKRNGIEEAWLIKGVKTIKAAPKEVVLRQLQGYAVLQP